MFVVTRMTWAVGAAVVLLNLPFGFWRAGLRRFSTSWFVAIHAPVPLIFVMRVLAGIRWHVGTFLVLAGAFFTGQLLGSRVRAWWAARRDRA